MLASHLPRAHYTSLDYVKAMLQSLILSSPSLCLRDATARCCCFASQAIATGLMPLDHAKGDPNTYPDLIIMQKLLLAQLEESAEEILLKEQNVGSWSGLWLESTVISSESENILLL